MLTAGVRFPGTIIDVRRNSSRVPFAADTITRSRTYAGDAPDHFVVPVVAA
jgi:hypothetical protein